ncbi:chitotriosidase-1-like [Echeneis naucrates]|uniref:chitotriosidase-1-like n=1 Tax=Echeneis naucrates TaxID=173247 RepID=UPI0011133274|nr:chitotriosidase-1-like [Echeneis naucrates]
MQAVKRSRFIGSAVNLLRTFGFDGLSLDFLPGAKKGRFTQLIQALKREFSAEVARSRRSRLLLVAGVSAEKDVIEASYDVRRIAGDLDFINVRTFNFRGARETVAVHHSPLFKGSQDAGNKMNSDTDFAMWHWRIQGAPAEKLNLGIASFGRVYTLTHTSSDVGAPVSGLGRKGNFTRTRGQWAYYEVCKNLGDAKIHEIPDQKVPYATVDDQWVGFDDLASLTTKVNYLKNNDFGGAFIWSLDLDDFSGDFCQQGKSPLTTSLHDLLFPEAPDVNNFCRSRPDGLYINPSNQHKFFSCAHGIT